MLKIISDHSAPVLRARSIAAPLTGRGLIVKPHHRVSLGMAFHYTKKRFSYNNPCRLLKMAYLSNSGFFGCLAFPITPLTARSTSAATSSLTSLS
jgi:hypothetical protein